MMCTSDQRTLQIQFSTGLPSCVARPTHHTRMACFNYPSNVVLTILSRLHPWPLKRESSIQTYIFVRGTYVLTFWKKSGVQLGGYRLLVELFWRCWVIQMRIVHSIVMRGTWYEEGIRLHFMGRLECIRWRMPWFWSGLQRHDYEFGSWTFRLHALLIIFVRYSFCREEMNFANIEEIYCNYLIWSYHLITSFSIDITLLFLILSTVENNILWKPP